MKFKTGDLIYTLKSTYAYALMPGVDHISNTGKYIELEINNPVLILYQYRSWESNEYICYCPNKSARVRISPETLFYATSFVAIRTLEHKLK